MLIVAVIAGFVLFTIVVSVVFRRPILRRLQRAAEGEIVGGELIKNGQKGRAQIVGIKPTGMVVNEIYVRTVLTFEIEPLDGSPTFDGQKKMLIDQTNQPRIGDTWPCWYDQTNHDKFAVEKPSGDARDQIEVYRDFGIAHPLDQ